MAKSKKTKIHKKIDCQPSQMSKVFFGNYWGDTVTDMEKELMVIDAYQGISIFAGFFCKYTAIE